MVSMKQVVLLITNIMNGGIKIKNVYFGMTQTIMRLM